MHPINCRCPKCLVDRSSFGTPEAKAARESVSDEQVARVLARMKELAVEDEPTPEALRDEGMAAAENAADPRVLLHIDAVIARANNSGRPWSANDIRAELPVAHGPLVGARVRAAAMRKEQVRVGYVPSTLPSTHSHPVAVWIGAEHAEGAA